MRILWVTTKAPWPERDGGRVLVANTLRALAAQGHRIALVSPFEPRTDERSRIASKLSGVCEPRLVAARPASMAMAFARARCNGLPVSINRHALRRVRDEVARVLSDERFDVVHAEQLQAIPQCAPAFRRAVPVVLRSQNVETDLWSGVVSRWRVVRRLVQREAARVARYEGQAVATAAVTVALTRRDADRLRALAHGGGVVRHVPAPFPDRLPGGCERLEGDPPVIVLGGGWLPNRDGAQWFLSGIWPDVRARCPRATLHVFGVQTARGTPPGVVFHGALPDSQAAFAPGAILAVPLRIASGARIKILEAWARGVAVVATPQAAAGLEAQDGEHLWIARDGYEFSRAIEHLHREPRLARESIAAGRAMLRDRHDPGDVASRLVEVYLEAAGQRVS